MILTELWPDTLSITLTLILFYETIVDKMDQRICQDKENYEIAVEWKWLMNSLSKGFGLKSYLNSLL